MSLNISFESEEEILGIVVNKPGDTVASNQLSNLDELSKITVVVDYHKNISQYIVILNKSIDNHQYIVDLLVTLNKTNSINKAMVDYINNVFPDLLGSKVNRDDFTDTPTRTNIQVIINFLIEKLNQINDDILVSYTDGVYRNLEAFINRTNSICLVDLESNFNDKKSLAAKQLDEIDKNNRIAVFKDGVLYKAIDHVLNPVFIDSLKLVSIPELDLGSLTTKTNTLKKLLEIHDNICPNTLINKDATYRELLVYLANLNIYEVIEHLGMFRDIMVGIVNEKKLLGTEGNIRDSLVSKVLENRYLNDLDFYVCRYIHVMILNYLYGEALSIAEDIV